MGISQNDIAHLSSTYKKAPTLPARAILCCVKFSHEFSNRSLLLEQKKPVKIGRSGPHTSCSSDNAIFDCVVISRDHARIWFEDGRFYLQDTKSSNGTFVNNELIGEKAKESPPKVIYTNDIVQFGSAVFSPDMKSRLGSIIAMLKLFLPDGSEAPTRPPSSVQDNPTVPTAQLYQLASYLEEAEHREQKLRKKLVILQHIVEASGKATAVGWKSLVQEDLLLSKVDFLQRQVETISKDAPDDRLRQEMVKLNETQCHSLEISKRYLEKALLERNEAIEKSENLERNRDNLETECIRFKTVAKRSQDDLKDLGQKYTLYFDKCQALSLKMETDTQLRDKCKMLEHEKRQLKEYAEKVFAEKGMLEKRLLAIQKSNALSTGTQSDLKVNTLDCKGPDPCSIIKQKFSVTVVNQNAEVSDDATSKVEHNDPGQTRLDSLLKRFERIERVHNIRVEKVNNIKLQLEKLKAQNSSNEDLKVALNIKECMDSIEAEPPLIPSRSNRSSKVDVANVDNTKYSNEIVNNLKSENTRLNLKLTEAEETLKYLSAKKDLYQTDFKTLTLKSLETVHENEELKKKLVEVHSEINARNNTIFELKKKMFLLEKSSEEELQHVMTMQKKLHEEQLEKNQVKRDVELCREELAKTQASLEKSQNEYAKLKTLVEELEVRSKFADDIEELRSEMAALQETCDSLKATNEQLKMECWQGEASKKTYQAAQNDFILLNQKLFEQMRLTEQMQTDLLDVEKERAMFSDLVRELTEMKQVCALRHEENENLMKKIDNIHANLDPAMRNFMPMVFALVFIFIVFILTQRQPLNSQIRDVLLVD